MPLPFNFGREVEGLLAEARQEYDRATFRIAAARDLARAYERAVGRPMMADLLLRLPGASGWILPPPGQLPQQPGPNLGQPQPGQGSERTRERQCLRVQSSRRRAGLPYYVYEDQLRDLEPQQGE